MTVRYAVTFEFETSPPVTHRGTVSGLKTRTCVVRAIDQAVEAHPHLSWSSLVVTLLERVEDPAGVTPVEEEV